MNISYYPGMRKKPEMAEHRGPGRPREFDIDEALAGAQLVFRERGYDGASLTDLSAGMKLTAGSIYKAFSDKRAIFLAAFDRYTKQRNSELQQLIDAKATGLAKLQTMLTFYAESAHGIEGRRGCLVVGSVAELTTYDAEMADRVGAALHRAEILLRKLIRLGQQDGSIPATTDVDALALTLLCFLQGLRVVGKGGRTRAEITAAVNQALRLIA